MTMQTCSDLPSRDRDARWFRERIQLLLELELFRQAFAEVHRYPNWKADPESLRQLGLVVHRFAPRSKDRGRAYGVGRALYRMALTHARDRLLRAEVLADLGASYFEEGRLHHAVDPLETSRALAPQHPRAHLGLLALACATRDLDAIRRRCEDLIGNIPCWYARREVVAALAADPDFAFLRASPELFLECFAGSPDDLRALHDRYCLEALEPALASFDTQDGEESGDLLEITNVVRQTFVTVEPILRSHTHTLRDVSAESLQALITF